MRKATLLINDVEVRFNASARRVIPNVLLALLDSLKLSKPPREAVFIGHGRKQRGISHVLFGNSAQ
jgi:hypothetical protein